MPEALQAELTQRWFAAIRRGDFAGAWEVSDRILAARAPGERCWHLPRHEQWVWDGRPLAGRRVLVRCYHGLGDTIQFARFLPRLDSIASGIIVWVQPALIDLLRTLSGNRQLLPLHDGLLKVDYDVDIEIMELAHALRIDASCVTDTPPYFNVPPARRLSEKFALGVVANTGGWDSRRSIPPHLMTDLTVSPGVEVFNLQLEDPLPGLLDLSTPDILELARRLRALDLVIAPDTMVAHLAGALGVPTWTLLPYDADWRWLQPQRADTPWYPSMRLFRQPRPGDWHSVVSEVRAQLSR